MVFRDSQTYPIAVVVRTMDVPNAAVSSFTSLIKNIGFITKETELLNVPNGVVSIISILTVTYRLSLRPALSVWPSHLGSCPLAFSHKGMKAAQLAGNYLTQCTWSALPLMYSITGTNVAGHTKEITMNAILPIPFCLGNILGPLTFRTQDEPDYIPAKIALVATISVAIIFVLVLRSYYGWESRRRDRRHEGWTHVQNSEFLDLSDRENRGFQVSWIRCSFMVIEVLLTSTVVQAVECYVLPANVQYSLRCSPGNMSVGRNMCMFRSFKYEQVYKRMSCSNLFTNSTLCNHIPQRQNTA